MTGFEQTFAMASLFLFVGVGASLLVPGHVGARAHAAREAQRVAPEIS